MALTAGVPLDQLDSQQISELQNLLLRAGYNPGAVDGVLGPATKAAYNRFLSKNNYAPAAGVTVVDLVSKLWSNEVPEYWSGVVYGNEVTQQATSSGRGAPAAPAPPAQTQPAGVPTTTSAAPATTTAVVSTPTVPQMNDAQTEAYVREHYPYLAYLLDDPEVRAILMAAAAKGDAAEATQSKLMATNWWKTTSETTRLWDAKFHLDNATAMKEWDQRTVSVTNLAQQLGVTMDAEGAKWVAGRILREGWSDEQLNRFFGQLMRNNGGAAPGKVTETSAQLKSLARSYMASMADKDAMEYAIRIHEGSTNREAIETMLRQEAKNRFSWLAPQIDSGLSPMDLFASTRQAVARELEIDPETIDLNDTRWSQLTSPVMEGNNTRSMNFAEAQRWARQRPEWRYTNNANSLASDVSLNLLKAMGVIA